MGNVNTNAILSDEEKSELSDDKHGYPFENLAFNGGGAMCIGQVGTLKVFDELGILKKITRFAGTSGGSITATMAALGYDPYQIEEILMQTNLEKLAIGHSYGYFSYPKYLDNLFKHYGLHTASSFEDWLGKLIEDKLEDSDATFLQLYKKTGKELAITATDVMRQDAVIYHVKTTPYMSIRKAVRMSVSIPAFFTPVHYEKGIFVDGGLVRNYPVMVYDGWFLSLKKGDEFLKRFKYQNPAHPLKDYVDQWDLENRFGEPKGKTVGVMVYSAFQQDIFKIDLENRTESYLESEHQERQPLPRSKLADERKQCWKMWIKRADDHVKLGEALDRFVEFLGATPLSRDEFIAKIAAATDPMKEDIHTVFGEYSIPGDLFDKLDVHHTEKLTFADINVFAGKRGFDLLRDFRLETQPQPPHNLFQYLFGVVKTTSNWATTHQLKTEDKFRSIGINTEYIKALDFDMQTADKEYLIQQGKIGTLAFLKYYNDHPKDPGNQENEATETAIGSGNEATGTAWIWK